MRLLPHRVDGVPDLSSEQFVGSEGCFGWIDAKGFELPPALEATPEVPPVDYAEVFAAYEPLVAEFGTEAAGAALEAITVPVTAAAGAVAAAAAAAVDVFHPLAVAAELPAAPAEEEEGEGGGGGGDGFVMPYGQTREFCPVSLGDSNCIIAGKPSLCAQYLERYYVFAGEAEQAAFLADPAAYVHTSEPTAPPPRLMVRGYDYSARGEAASYLNGMHGVPVLVLAEELATLVANDPKPEPPAPPEPEGEPEGEPEAEGEAEAEPEPEAEAEPEAEPEPPVWQDHVAAYLANPAEAPLPSDVFEECVTKILSAEPFASSGYIWEAGGGETNEQLSALLALKMGPEAVVYVEVTDEIARARAPKPVIPEPEPAPGPVEPAEGEEPEPVVEPEPVDVEALTEAHYAAISAAVEAEAANLAALEELVGAALLQLIKLPTPAAATGRGTLYAQLNDALRRNTAERGSLFAEVKAVSAASATTMLASGSALLSIFGTLCPVTMMADMVRKQGAAACAALYRHQLYYLVGPAEKEAFLADPVKYATQPAPLPEVNPCVAVTGPEPWWSAKVASKLARSLGACLLAPAAEVAAAAATPTTLGAAAKAAGDSPTDALVVQVLAAKAATQACAAGWVLDGFPATAAQALLLEAAGLIPTHVFELAVPEAAALDRYAALGAEIPPMRALEAAAREAAASPESAIVADVDAQKAAMMAAAAASETVRLASACSQLAGLELLCTTLHDSMYLLPGASSCWGLYAKAAGLVAENTKRRQMYLVDTAAGTPAPLYDLGTTPFAMDAGMGPTGFHCPISLAKRSLLIDCSKKLDLAVSVALPGGGKAFYAVAGAAEHEVFITAPPSDIAAPAALRLPKALGGLACAVAAADESAALNGCCPVALTVGTATSGKVVAGKPQFSAEYNGAIYTLSSADALAKFLRSPATYAEAVAPETAAALSHGKLPPAPLKTLPAVGYLEQTVSDAIAAALTKIGVDKPKLPLLDPTSSALLALALQLRATNPNGSKQAADKEKLAGFEEQCQFVPRALADMAGGMEWRKLVRYKELEALRESVKGVVAEYR